MGSKRRGEMQNPLGGIQAYGAQGAWEVNESDKKGQSSDIEVPRHDLHGDNL